MYAYQPSMFGLEVAVVKANILELQHFLKHLICLLQVLDFCDRDTTLQQGDVSNQVKSGSCQPQQCAQY